MDINETTKRFDKLRSMALMPLSFFSLAGIGAVAVINFVEEGGNTGLIEAIVATAVIINLFYFLQHNNVRVASQMLVAAIGVFLSASLYTDSASRIGEYWIIIFPVVAVLFLGRYVASIFTGLFLASAVPAALLTSSRLLKYTASELAAVMFATSITLAFMVYYDLLLNESLNETDEESAAAESTSSELKIEVAQRESAETKMAEVLRKLEVNNAKLEQVTAIDEATIASIGEAVLIIDKDGSVMRANPSAGRVLGVNQEELIGSPISQNLQFTKQGEESTVLTEEQIVIEQSMTHRSINEETYQISTTDSEPLYVQMTASPLVVSGEVYGAVVAVRDVTSETEVDQAKSEFVSIASHQLRTPLSTINWYLEMTLAGDFGELNGEQTEFIKEAYMAGKRMGDLINALLNASRLDVGVIAVEPQEEVDIRDVVRGVLSDLEAKIAAKKIHIETEIDDTVKPAKLDPRIMDIIILNMLTNAVKYSPAGADVYIHATTDEKNMVISVTDRGYGIPANVQDKIFTKMFRADNAVEHEPDGNGLGLYIIKEILDTVGGSIAFVSKENEGTVFTVRIPKTGMQSRDGAKQLSLNPDLN